MPIFLGLLGDWAGTQWVLTKWQLSFSTSLEGWQRQVVLPLCPAIPDLSLHSRPTDGSLSDRVVIRPSQDEGYLLLMCAHLLGESSPHKTPGFICKFRGTKITSIPILPVATCSVLFTQTQDLCGVLVTRIGCQLCCSLWAGEPSSLLSLLLSKTTQWTLLASCQRPDRRKGGLAMQPPSLQQKATEPGAPD